jgi:MOSC domain-containing protein YiiM
METVAQLTSRFPRAGRVEFIGVRPARRQGVVALSSAQIDSGGIAGDHHDKPGARAVTLIQWEHLAVIAALTGNAGIEPELLRRNIAVSGINLSALNGAKLAIGCAIVELAGPCAPCSRMEELLGPGGYNAMRGHGGWTASVVQPGRVQIGDAVTALRPG